MLACRLADTGQSPVGRGDYLGKAFLLTIIQKERLHLLSLLMIGFLCIMGDQSPDEGVSQAIFRDQGFKFQRKHMCTSHTSTCTLNESARYQVNIQP